MYFLNHLQSQTVGISSLSVNEQKIQIGDYYFPVVKVITNGKVVMFAPELEINYKLILSCS